MHLEDVEVERWIRIDGGEVEGLRKRQWRIIKMKNAEGGKGEMMNISSDG